MNNIKPLFNLPEKPIDKYRIDYFLISVSAYWYYINHMHAIYYVNTPYDDLGIGTDGLPLIDDWMIYKNGCATGRFEGWKKPEKYVTTADCFLTEQEAKKEVVTILKSYAKESERKIVGIRKMIREIKP